MRKAFTLVEEPRNHLYVELLREGLDFCTRISLVQRPTCVLSATAKVLLERLRPWLLNVQEVAKWPGTELLEGTAVLREYEFTEQAFSVIATAVEGLYDWCQPEMPEDLVLLRNDGEPWLVTIAHERDAYLWMTETEQAVLLEKLPGLRHVLVHLAD